MDVFKRAKRLQCYAQKITISLDVLDLLIPIELRVLENEEETMRLSFCIGKGDKMVCSEDFVAKKEAQALLFSANLSKRPGMELPLTIYRDRKSHSIQEKTCDLVLRNKTFGESLTVSYKEITRTVLQLHEILATMDFDAPQLKKVMSFSFPLGITTKVSIQLVSPEDKKYNFAKGESGLDHSISERASTEHSDDGRIPRGRNLTFPVTTSSDDNTSTASEVFEILDGEPMQVLHSGMAAERKETVFNEGNHNLSSENRNEVWECEKLELIEKMEMKMECMKNLKETKEQCELYRDLLEREQAETNSLREQVERYQSLSENLKKQLQVERHSLIQSTERVMLLEAQNMTLRNEKNLLLELLHIL